jgi:hypothetical protein
MKIDEALAASIKLSMFQSILGNGAKGPQQAAEAANTAFALMYPDNAPPASTEPTK